MLTPQHRFTVLQAQLVLLLGFLMQPALRVVKVAARGLGLEYDQPWHTFRSRTGLSLKALSTLAAALVMSLVFPAMLLASPLVMGMALSEGRHAGEFLMGERPDGGSRDNVTVLSGQNLKAGAVIGRVNKGVGRVSVPTVVGTGNGTATLVYAGPDVLVGNYVVTCTAAATNAGTFSVTNPASKALPAATVGVAYTSREINFTLNDGGTDFIVGDSFTFVVSSTAPTVVGTGNGTVSSITLGPDAITGNYRVENIEAITNGGTFKIIGPDGDVVDTGSIVAGAGGTLVLSVKRHLNITITDASTDFAVGDFFNVCVYNNLNGGKAVAWDPTTYDGRDDIAGVLLDNVDASSGDVAGAFISRDAVVIKASLEWAAAITAAQKESAYKELALLGIVAR